MTNDDDLACRDLVEVVTDYLEDEMAVEMRVRFEAHLATCAACREYVDQIRSTVTAARATGGEGAAASVPPALLEAFRAWRKG